VSYSRKPRKEGEKRKIQYAWVKVKKTVLNYGVCGREGGEKDFNIET